MLDVAATGLLFRNRLQGLTTYPGDDYLKVRSRPFTPPNPNSKQLWIEEIVEVTSEKLTSWGLIEVLGITQYLINYPVGKGIESPDALTKAVAERFEPPMSLSGSGIELALYRSYRAAPTETDLWYSAPVFILWRSHVATSTP